jgi:hypothetical protein
MCEHFSSFHFDNSSQNGNNEKLQRAPKAVLSNLHGCLHSYWTGPKLETAAHENIIS